MVFITDIAKKRTPRNALKHVCGEITLRVVSADENDIKDAGLLLDDIDELNAMITLITSRIEEIKAEKEK